MTTAAEGNLKTYFENHLNQFERILMTAYGGNLKHFEEYLKPVGVILKYAAGRYSRKFEECFMSFFFLRVYLKHNIKKMQFEE